jgi:glycosyltransferase involved in cell wall biosynthesis
MLTTTFYPDIGGAEFLAAELAKGLAAEGFRVIFLARKKSLPSPSWCQTPAIDFRPILATIGIGGLVESLFKVFMSLARERLAVVHAHFAVTPGLIALPLVILRRVPLVITSPGSDILPASKVAYGAILRTADKILTRIVLRFSSAHVVLCQAMVANALASGSDLDKVRVIYPGVYDPTVRIGTENRTLESFGLTSGDTLILFIGRLVASKAADDLVRAAPRILEALPSAMIIVAGGGPEGSKLAAIAKSLGLKDRIRFSGMVTQKDRYALLDRCDVFVIPSLFEGMPHILLEALAFGKPIVATNIPPFREILADDNDAVLVPVNSPEELANGVVTLAKRYRHRPRAKEKSKNRFGVKRMIESYVKMYDELLAPKPV